MAQQLLSTVSYTVFMRDVRLIPQIIEPVSSIFNLRIRALSDEPFPPLTMGDTWGW